MKNKHPKRNIKFKPLPKKNIKYNEPFCKNKKNNKTIFFFFPNFFQ